MKNQGKSLKERWAVPTDIRDAADAGRLLALPGRDQAVIAKINQFYVRLMFGTKGRNTEFANYGYWERHTRTYRAACENLMEKLPAFIPEKKAPFSMWRAGKEEPPDTF